MIYIILGLAILTLIYIIKYYYSNRVEGLTSKENENIFNSLTSPLNINNVTATAKFFNDVGCAAYSEELDMILFISTKTIPYTISTNVMDFILYNTPLNKIATIDGTSAFNNAYSIDVVWSYKKKEFLFAIGGQSTVFKSSDGINWMSYKTNMTMNFKTLKSADKLDIYYLQDANSSALYISNDGITWNTAAYNGSNTNIIYDDQMGLLIWCNTLYATNSLTFMGLGETGFEFKYHNLTFNKGNGMRINKFIIIRENRETYLHAMNGAAPYYINKVNLTNYPIITDELLSTDLSKPLMMYGWCKSANLIYSSTTDTFDLYRSDYTQTVPLRIDGNLNNIEKDIGLNGIFISKLNSSSSGFIKFEKMTSEISDTGLTISDIKIKPFNFGGIGTVAYAKELNMSIFINKLTTPFTVSTNVNEFILNNEPLNEIGVVDNTKGLNRYDKIDVVWSYSKKEFLLMINDTNVVYKSSDGINWTSYKTKLINYVSLISADKLGVYVMKPSNNIYDRLMFSNDGIVWEKVIYGNSYINDILYDDELGVLLYTGYPNYPNAITFVKLVNNEFYSTYYKLKDYGTQSTFLTSCVINKENGRTYLNCTNPTYSKYIYIIDITDYPIVTDTLNSDGIPTFSVFNGIKSSKLMYTIIGVNMLLFKNNFKTKLYTIPTSINATSIVKDIGLNGIFIPTPSGTNSLFIRT